MLGIADDVERKTNRNFDVRTSFTFNSDASIECLATHGSTYFYQCGLCYKPFEAQSRCNGGHTGQVTVAVAVAVVMIAVVELVAVIVAVIAITIVTIVIAANYKQRGTIRTAQATGTQRQVLSVPY